MVRSKSVRQSIVVVFRARIVCHHGTAFSDAPNDRKPLAEHGGHNLMGSSTSTSRGNSSSTRHVDKDVDVNMDEEPEIEILD